MSVENYNLLPSSEFKLNDKTEHGARTHFLILNLMNHQSVDRHNRVSIWLHFEIICCNVQCHCIIGLLKVITLSFAQIRKTIASNLIWGTKTCCQFFVPFMQLLKKIHDPPDYFLARQQQFWKWFLLFTFCSQI